MMDDKCLLDPGEIFIVSLSVILMGLSYIRITAPDTPREKAGSPFLICQTKGLDWRIFKSTSSSIVLINILNDTMHTIF